MSNKTVYEDKDFKAVLEVKDEILFIHCYTNSFSKAVLKQMREVFEEIKVACAAHGWEDLFSYTPNPKFGRLFGGEKIDEFEHLEKTYEVLRWELELR